MALKSARFCDFVLTLNLLFGWVDLTDCTLSNKIF